MKAEAVVSAPVEAAGRERRTISLRLDDGALVLPVEFEHEAGLSGDPLWEVTAIALGELCRRAEAAGYEITE